MGVGAEDGVAVGDFVGVIGQVDAAVLVGSGCATPVLADVVGPEASGSAVPVAGAVPDTPGPDSVGLGCASVATGATVGAHLAVEA